jgi:hypothetical protein
MLQAPKEKVYKPVWFCIYCSDGRIKQATKQKLSAEHIIPFGLALQLLFRTPSESMGNHDSTIVDAGGVN